MEVILAIYLVIAGVAFPFLLAAISKKSGKTNGKINDLLLEVSQKQKIIDTLANELTELSQRLDDEKKLYESLSKYKEILDAESYALNIRNEAEQEAAILRKKAKDQFDRNQALCEKLYNDSTRDADRRIAKAYFIEYSMAEGQRVPPRQAKAKKQSDQAPLEGSDIKSQRIADDVPDASRVDSSFQASHYSKKDIRNIAFTYIDSKGELSERKVAVNNLYETTFTAYCLKRRATRTFNLCGIIGDITITSTGELISPQKWADAFEVAAI